MVVALATATVTRAPTAPAGLPLLTLSLLAGLALLTLTLLTLLTLLSVRLTV